LNIALYGQVTYERLYAAARAQNPMEPWSSFGTLFT
jgi:hypothetical protein